jgi:Xaa-Pro aminopeptidase
MRSWVPASAVVCVALLATSTWPTLSTVSAVGSSAVALDPAEHAARRGRLMAEIGDGAAIILGATTPASDVAFRQGHDFFYLTGVEIPDAMLVVDGVRKESVLFFTMDEKTAGGFAIPIDLVRAPVAYTGIERAMAAEQFGGYLAGLVNRRQPLYTMFKPEEIGPENSNEKFNALQKSMTLNVWDGRLTRELQFVKQLRERFPQADVRDSSPIVWNLRKYKSAAELSTMREAARLGVEGHKALIRSTRPGVAERALAAVFDFVTAKDGARGLAYYTIIMSGKNHAYGHYHGYDRVLDDGDFVILDAAPAYGSYHVDISTTFPAGGRFTPRQRELYEAALVVHDAAIENYRPGITLREVGRKMEAALAANGLQRFAKDFASIIRVGGYNHSIGLATHDVMGTFAGPDEVLQPGFVFACDIQLFRLDEQIGIRIEDTVAITDTGREVLSRGVPRTVAEIEALKREEGILQIIDKRVVFHKSAVIL